jgi:transcription elongation GreA/GreB family factor
MMEEYLITKEEYEELKKALDGAQERTRKATKDKSDAGAGQDAWHDENFKLGIAEEAKWKRQEEEIKSIIRNVRIIEPVEQADIAQIGNGVRIAYDSGKELEFILGGYHSGAFIENRVSIYSPVGEAVVGTKEGEICTFRVGKEETRIKVKKILSPSNAEKIFTKEYPPIN